MHIRFLQVVFLLINVVSPKFCALNVGSVFFNRDRTPSSWDDRDLARLRARRVIQLILPRETSPNDIDSKYIHDVLQYFRLALKKFKKTNRSTREILTEVFADTVGGYLRSELLPNARYSFYAGNINYDDVNALNCVYNEVKHYLNTEGWGWANPTRLKRNYEIKVDRIDISPKQSDPCSKLILTQDSQGCIKVPMPKLDENDNPSSLALPWKECTLYGLTSKRSSRVIVTFYRTASECILKESSESCKSSAFSRFNRDLCHWLKKEITPHLADEKWYPGFGGVLRVGATVHGFCNSEGDTLGISLPEHISLEDITLVERHKDELFQNSNTYVLVQLVGLIAAFIWLFLSMLTCFYRNRWRSKEKHENREEAVYISSPKRSHSYGTDTEIPTNHSRHSGSIPGSRVLAESSQINTAKVNSSMKNNPVVNTALMSASAMVDSTFTKHFGVKTSSGKNTAMNTPPRKTPPMKKTEHVYDLNEQKIKEMSVVDYADVASVDQTVEQQDSSRDSRSSITGSTELTGACRSISPPCIETSMSEFHVKKTIRSDEEKLRLPVYTTSEATSASRSRCGRRSGERSTQTFVKPSESMSSSMWTSSSGTRAGSSVESQGVLQGSAAGSGAGCARRSVARIAKDLAWAKRLASRHRRKEPDEAADKSTALSRGSYKSNK